MPGLDYLLLGLVSGLAAIERKGFLQAMLSRPIALAPAVGLLLGDLEGGLRLGPPLELLWLGAVNLGAALPVNEALGAAAVTGGAVLAGRALGGGVTPEVAVLALLVAAPAAILGRRADRWAETRNERLAERAEELLACGEPRAAVRENLIGLLRPFAIGMVLGPAFAALAAGLVPLLLRSVPSASGPLAIGWAACWGLAAAAGARALRARLGPVLFLAALAAGTLGSVLAGSAGR